MRATLTVLAALALGGAGPPMNGPPAPLLKARPSAAGPELRAGESWVANGARVYRPSNAKGPLPLVVLLHGAGGYPPNFLQSMKPVADRLGVILIQPHSSGRTWDLLLNMQMGAEPWHGPDARRLDQSLTDLFSQAAVDPSRVVLLGFSDGATYALSLGTANPKLFTTVVALSPGGFAAPDRIDRAQKIFIAHGKADAVLPFAQTKQIADALHRAGANVRFRQFKGGHQVDPESLVEALDWALGLQAQPQPPTSAPK